MGSKAMTRSNSGRKTHPFKISDDHDGQFGERLKQLRVRQGYAQKEVANQIDVSTRTLTNWETGTSLPPLGPTLRKLAAFFRVSPGYLLNGEED